jgi:hypothetical protein
VSASKLAGITGLDEVVNQRSGGLVIEPVVLEVWR